MAFEISNTSDHGTSLDLLRNEYLQKSVDIYKLVERLKFYLTNDDNVERAKGIKFLGDLFDIIHFDHFSDTELRYLSAFIVARLSDHYTVVPYVIYSLKGMVKQINLKKEDGISILRGLFSDIVCQSLLKADRMNVFYLFKHCLLNRIEWLKSMGAEFLIGFIQAMDGEKDPRNLMILFSTIPVIARQMPLENLAEDLFEVVGAYFPIDFRPPIEDPYGIRPDDLITSLRECIAASDLFAPYSIPLIQDKIESDLTPAKIDSFLTLQYCCKNYGSESVRPFLLTLWPVLRKQAVEGRTKEVENLSYETLESLIACIERPPSTQMVRETMEYLGEQVTKECLGHLLNPENRLMSVSINLLASVSKFSQYLTDLILPKSMDILLEQWKTRSDKAVRKSLLEAMSKFVYNDLVGEKSSEYFNKYIACLTYCLQSQDEDMVAFSLEIIAKGSPLFVQDSAGSLAKIMFDFVQANNDESFTDQVLACVTILSKQNRGSVTELFLLPLIELVNLSNRLSQRNSIYLSRLVERKDEVERLIPVMQRLINERIDTKICIQGIKEIVVRLEKNEPCFQYFLVEIDLLKVAIKWLFFLILFEESHSDRIVQLRNLSVIIQCLARESDADFVEEGICFCLNHLVTSRDGWAELEHFKEALTKEGESKMGYIFYILEGLLLGYTLHSDKILRDVLVKIESWIIMEFHVDIVQDMLILHSCTLNKLLGNDPTEVLSTLKERHLIVQEQTQMRTKLLGSVAKAIVTRGLHEESLWLDALDRILTQEFGRDAAECYQFLMQDHSRHYSSGTGVKVKFLYKQKLFQSRIDCLFDKFKSNAGKNSFNILIAITYLINGVPPTILSAYTDKIVPVLCQGLSSVDVTDGCIRTLSHVLKHGDSQIAMVGEHIGSLTKQLLNHALVGNIHVRLTSLECIHYLSQLPITVIVPYKYSVLKGLTKCLSDRKRIVRSKAMNAKCSWMMAGEDERGNV